MKTQEIIELGQKYVMNTYGRLPMALVKGEGAFVWDAEGNKYLDFVAGLAVNSLGHCHPKVVEAIREQAETLMHVSNLYWIEPQVKLAKLLVENSALDKVFFCNSGAEANEGAIKLARKYAKKYLGPDKYEIITMEKSFHGRTLAAITATAQPKYQKDLDPLPPGFKYVPFNDFAALEKAISPNTCAIMMEPVQGEGGVNVADYDYMQQVKQLCLEKNLLLIFDEVQCGLGRTGKLFAYEHYNVEPNIMTLAKAIAGGFPMGALLATDKVAECFQPGDHASTFGGNPLAAAAGCAAVSILADKDFLVEVAEKGAYFEQKLHRLKDKYSFITDVRGKGLILGLGITVDGKSIVDGCLQKGLIINCVGSNVLRFIPPLIITKQNIDDAVNIIDEVMSGLSFNEVEL
ncbi:acetylornithine transaminase [Thermincola potens]|uniref:Acetylornithine aminotransferase n=1 Tax=Thermincola potens (strain JR) TaxID=635013 RepID=D5XAD8_THEPJ|nr:acetylornithine transaminase [Thermincola potens]ADG81237.1 acetylornithine and succinylornithine aminotransferase [Thermincola potens JR]